MITKNMICLAIHAKSLIEQTIHKEGNGISFIEPCKKCQYLKECDLAWYDYIDNALKSICGAELEVHMKSKAYIDDKSGIH